MRRKSSARRVRAAVVVEGALPRPLLPQQVEVDVGDRHLRRPSGSARSRRAARRSRRSWPGRPRRDRWSTRPPRRRRRVGGQAARRLRLAQQPPRLGLADGDVAGRQVGEHRRAGQRRRAAGGTGTQKSSQISACTTRPGTSVGREQQIGAERRGRAPPIADRLAAVPVARGEMPLLVELAVVRQVDLRHDAEQPAAVDGERAVVEPAADGAAARRPAAPAAGPADPATQRVDGVLDRVEQRVLQQQVVDRVAGEREFGEHGERRPCGRTGPRAPARLRRWPPDRRARSGSCRRRRARNRAVEGAERRIHSGTPSDCGSCGSFAASGPC